MRKSRGKLLAEEEILVKRQGIGTFVSQKKLCRNINGFMGFTQSCLAEGNTAGAQLVSAELAEATMVDAEELKIQEHEKIIKIVRVRTCDGIPVMLEEKSLSGSFPAYLFRAWISQAPSIRYWRRMGQLWTMALSGLEYARPMRLSTSIWA
ncbi:MAG: UTRA domain-containing protein [Enterocloster clostridioformis]